VDAGDQVPDAETGPDATPTGDVEGSFIDTHVTVAGLEIAAHDLSSATIEALVPDGTGGYTTIAGVGRSDGTFGIQDVPDGIVLIRIDTFYFATAGRDLDLGYNLLGRRDTVAATTSPTTLSFDVDNMSAWQEGDRLDLMAPNTPAGDVSLELFLTPAPEVDDVALTGSYDWSQAVESNLIDTNKSDTAYLLHYTEQLDGAETYSTLTQAAEIGSLTMTNGGTSTVTGTFGDVTLDQTVSVNIDGAAWEASRASLCTPDHVLDGNVGVTLYISPFGLNRGDLGYVELGSYSPADSLDHSLTMHYGDPFPGDWVPYETAFMLVLCNIDTAQTTHGMGYMSVSDAAGALFGDVKPRLGPIGDPRVDGMSATVEVTANSTTPTISFDAPATGTADAYYVSIRELGTGGRGTLVATFLTTSTSIVVPAGVLTSGSSYFVEITAEANAEVDYEAAPRRRGDATSANSRRPTARIVIP